jgi:hypothetical protein
MYTTQTNPVAVRIPATGRYGRSRLCLAPLIHLLRGPHTRAVRPREGMEDARGEKKSVRGFDVPRR